MGDGANGATIFIFGKLKSDEKIYIIFYHAAREVLIIGRIYVLSVGQCNTLEGRTIHVIRKSILILLKQERRGG